MLSSDDDGDFDVFYDSLDSLSGQESVLAEEFGFERRYDEIWVNEPVSVKERRELFLQGMDLAYSSSKILSQEKTMRFNERIMECSGAVSNACIFPSDKVSEKTVFSGWNATSEAEVLLGGLKGRREDEVDASFQWKMDERVDATSTAPEHREREDEAQEEFWNFDKSKTSRNNWWKRFVNVGKGDEGKVRSKLSTGMNKTSRIKVRRNKKRWLEFGEVYVGQEIKAHKGLVWTMKFSPNGEYLASGGEDGVVRIWRVMSRDKSQPFIFLPNDIFQIEESPLQELFGHSSDILDLAWSNSDVSLTCRTKVAIRYVHSACRSNKNYMLQILLSSSMDKTVRAWKIGCDQCLRVFPHKDFGKHQSITHSYPYFPQPFSY